MSLLKVCVLLAVAVTFASSEDLGARPIEAKSGNAAELSSKESRASVVGTNLSGSEAVILANQLQYIYNTVADPLIRATRFRDYLQARYSNMYNQVIIQFRAYAIYQRYYIVILVNGEYVLAFGV